MCRSTITEYRSAAAAPNDQNPERGEQEIVIKSLSKHVGEAKGLSGATILGDGRIALIVDVNGLLAIATERKVETYAA